MHAAACSRGLARTPSVPIRGTRTGIWRRSAYGSADAPEANSTIAKAGSARRPLPQGQRALSPLRLRGSVMGHPVRHHPQPMAFRTPCTPYLAPVVHEVHRAAAAALRAVLHQHRLPVHLHRRHLHSRSMISRISPQPDCCRTRPGSAAARPFPLGDFPVSSGPRPTKSSARLASSLGRAVGLPPSAAGLWRTAWCQTG
jgi:hypothetical protein